MTPSTASRRSCALLLAAALPAGTASAHSRQIAHGPTRPSFVGVAPPDGVSPRLILRHRTDDGAAIEADPVTVTDTARGARFAEHLHGRPLLESGLGLRTELVLDRPTICAKSDAQAARYRLRDIANALRHTFTPGERFAVTLLETGKEPARLPPTDRASEVLPWLTAQCGDGAGRDPLPPFDRAGFGRLRGSEKADANETVVWLLLMAGTTPRLTAEDGVLLAEAGIGLLENFAPATPEPPLAPAAQREPGQYQTDPIVNHLRTEGVRTTPPPGSGWRPFCDAVAAQGGSCLFGGLLPGANAMTTQRLLAEAQALFVTPISCLPGEAGPVEIATETGKVTVPAAALEPARCDRWQTPAEATSAPSKTGAWVALAGLLLAAGGGGLWLRRRRAARAIAA